MKSSGSVITMVSLTFLVACGARVGQGNGDTDSSETGDPGDGDPGDGDPGDGDPGDGDPGDGDPGDGDGDGDGVMRESCEWLPMAAAECDIAFAPVAPEPSLPDYTQTGISSVDIMASADAVEIAWLRYYHIAPDAAELRRYLTSNTDGPWQHQFLDAMPCDPDLCGESLPRPEIAGSSGRAHVSPPYLRREGGQWESPVFDPRSDPLSIYNNPNGLTVGPDDRSYLMRSGYQEGQLAQWVWAETDSGCHVPIWRIQVEGCASSVSAMAVDAEGLLHATGIEDVARDQRRLVHWLVGPDDVQRTELGPPPAGVGTVSQALAIGESNEIHLCHWGVDQQNVLDGVMLYSHGYDAEEWTTLEIEDPDAADSPGPSRCNLALAPDGTAWLGWSAGDFGDPMNPLRVASVVDDVITYEIVDFDAQENSVSLAVDPMGRPWLAYLPEGIHPGTFKVAYKDGGQWIVEEIDPG